MRGHRNIECTREESKGLHDFVCGVLLNTEYKEGECSFSHSSGASFFDHFRSSKKVLSVVSEERKKSLEC